MKTVFLAACLFFIAFWAAAEARAESSPYVLETKRPKSFGGNSTLKLKNKKTGRVIWSTTVDYDFNVPNKVHWSKDRRAVAIETRTILVWREGYRLRNFGVPGKKRYLYDYSLGCIWSPDKERLLVRFSASGGGDEGVGTLYSLKLGRWPCYEYTQLPNRTADSSGVREMAWKDSRHALYWLYVSSTRETAKQPRVWRVP